MKLLYRCCAGMDVHKSSVSVCVRRRIRGGHFEMDEAMFGTFTQDLKQLRQWLKERNVRQVAMESTGVYWICTIPGVDKTTARVLVAELGTDMEQFPSAAHAASWAGLCPGNSESAGKRFSGRTRKGDRYLRRILVQSGWAAARTRDCFLAAMFNRIAHRRGFKKAVVAVAHRILTIAWSIIRNGSEYQERGGDHFDRLHPERTARKLARRLERIGFNVAITPRNAVPSRPAVEPSLCRKCAAWGLAECIHAVPQPKRKNKPRTPKDSIP